MMKHLYSLTLAFLLIGSSTASAGYACPAAGDSSGGWVPQECVQKQESISQYACPPASDTRGGWIPPACTTKKVACPDCGVVEKINMTDESATGLGAAAGAIAGGLIGSRIGDKNKKLSTAIGAVAGGVGGHYAEKKLLKRKRWDVIVLMDDGTHRTVEFDAEPGYKVGDKVKVDGDSLTRQKIDEQ